MSSARPRLVSTVALIFGAALLSGCGRSDSSVDAQPTPPPPTVVAAVVVPRTIPISADFVGTTASVQSVQINARVTGTLDSVNFKEGTLVKVGQLLFTIEKAKYEAAVQTAQANVLKAKATLYQAKQSVPVLQAGAIVQQNRAKVANEQLNVDRLTPLAAAHAIPQRDLDNAIAELAVGRADLVASVASFRNARVAQVADITSAQAAVLGAQADLSNAKLNLSYCTVHSPVTGIIGFLTNDVGNVVGNAGSQTLDTVSTVDPIEVLFSADEGTYLALADKRVTYEGHPLRNQYVTLLLSNNKIYPERGTLYTVSRTLDVKTGTIQVEARFPNPDGYLRPGQFGRVRLITEERDNAIVIPQTAVVQTQGSANAYIVEKDDTVALRSLSLGPVYDNSSYIVNSGLKAGDRLIVEGVQKAVPGRKVVVAAAAAKI
jgi:membrane fusion protein, multidrug efflux system